MKPHRIRMAHNLIVNYGMCDEEGQEHGPAEVWGEGKRMVNDEMAQNWGGGLMGEAEMKWEKAALSGSRSKMMQVFVCVILPFFRSSMVNQILVETSKGYQRRNDSVSHG